MKRTSRSEGLWTDSTYSPKSERSPFCSHRTWCVGGQRVFAGPSLRTPCGGGFALQPHPLNHGLRPSIGVLKRRSRERWVRTLAELVNCPERKAFAEGRVWNVASAAAPQRRRGGKVPGFGSRRPWESLESLLTWKHPCIVKATHGGPALPAPGAAARLLNPACLWAQSTAVREGAAGARASSQETSLPMRHGCSDWKEQEDTATKDSLATTSFEKTTAPHLHQLRLSAQSSAPQAPSASSVVFSANSIRNTQENQRGP